MNEITRYENGMDKALLGFSDFELNMLMMLLDKAKEVGPDKDIVIDMDELKKICGNKVAKKSSRKFAESLIESNWKLMNLTTEYEDDSRIIQFVLFPTFSIDLEKEILTFSVNKELSYFVNNFNDWAESVHQFPKP